MKNFLRRARYNYFISRILTVFLYPAFWGLSRIAKQITIKVKINGRKSTYSGIELKFPRNVGININTRVYWSGLDGFETLTGKTLLILFENAGTFFDVGSNFGFYSVLAQKANKTIQVFCFEPLPNIFRDNQRFHQENNVNNQTLYNLALSNQVGTATIYVPDVYAVNSEITSSSIEKDFFYNQKFPHKELTIETSTLDHIVKGITIEKTRPVVMKIDVEGHEAAVLSGGNEFFKTFRPFVVIEIDNHNDRNLEEIFDFVDRHRYLIYSLTSAGYFRMEKNDVVEFRHERDFLLIPAERAVSAYLSFEGLKKLNSNY